MKEIGAHVSVSGGVEMAPVNALGIGADAFAPVSYTHLCDRFVWYGST